MLDVEPTLGEHRGSFLETSIFFDPHGRMMPIFDEPITAGSRAAGPKPGARSDSAPTTTYRQRLHEPIISHVS